MTKTNAVLVPVMYDVINGTYFMFMNCNRTQVSAIQFDCSVKPRERML